MQYEQVDEALLQRARAVLGPRLTKELEAWIPVVPYPRSEFEPICTFCEEELPCHVARMLDRFAPGLGDSPEFGKPEFGERATAIAKIIVKVNQTIAAEARRTKKATAVEERSRIIPLTLSGTT